MTTPETLAVTEVSEALAKTGVGLAAVDEAHCISEWGHDFRPAYRRLGARLRALGAPPLLALTATATPRVRTAIVRSLGMRDPSVVASSPHRSNLAFEVIHCEGDMRLRALLRLVTATAPPRHRLLRDASGGGHGLRRAAALRHPRTPLPRRDERDRAERGAEALHAPAPPIGDGRHQRLRPRHRQAGHPLHPPLPVARLPRAVRAGSGAQRPRRQEGQLHPPRRSVGSRDPRSPAGPQPGAAGPALPAGRGAGGLGPGGPQPVPGSPGAVGGAGPAGHRRRCSPRSRRRD